MAMVLPRPSTSGTRPAYLDSLFKELPPPPVPALTSSPSLRSARSNNSFSSTSDVQLEFRPVQSKQPRPLSPAFEEEQSDDRMSVRSLRLNLSPRLKLRNFLNRRTYPQVQETIDQSTSTSQSSPFPPRTSSRRPSLPKLQTSFTSPLSPPRKVGSISTKPLVIIPEPPVAEELKCQPCYYFAARNCNGYVMGGNHGDACETCAQAGFFGAP